MQINHHQRRIQFRDKLKRGSTGCPASQGGDDLTIRDCLFRRRRGVLSRVWRAQDVPEPGNDRVDQLRNLPDQVGKESLDGRIRLGRRRFAAGGTARRVEISRDLCARIG